MSKVAVVGGGAAGMFASIFAARNGNEVHLFEKNEKLGKKLFITGKGRCNITNACDMEDLMKAKCEKYGIPFDVLNDDEKAKLREEIEAEQSGMVVCDSILDDPEIGIRAL